VLQLVVLLVLWWEMQLVLVLVLQLVVQLVLW
jgi:hypothetical protein